MIGIGPAVAIEPAELFPPPRSSWRSGLCALPPPTASGVRVAGDQFQWLIAWVECLRMYLDQQREAPNPTVEVELEARDGMNLDDVVVRRRRPPHTPTFRSSTPSTPVTRSTSPV